MRHFIIKFLVIVFILVYGICFRAGGEEGLQKGPMEAGLMENGPTDGFALIKLQMQAVQKQGEATFALAAKNIDGAISANAEAASISRTVIKYWQRMAPDLQKQFGPTAETASSTILSSMKNMAYLYRQIQKYEEAESALNEAKAIAEERNDSIQKIECMKEAAELKWARKSYLAASLLYEKIVREQEPEIVKDPKWDLPSREGGVPANRPDGDALAGLPASGTTQSQAGFMDQLTELNDAITKWGAYIQLASLYTYMCDLENSLRIFRLPGFIRLREWLQYRGNLSSSFDENTPFGILNWAANLFPSYYHLGKGQVLNRLERYQDALTEFASASALLAGRPLPEAHFALANLKGFSLQKLGKFDEAVALYREGTLLTASMSPGIREISECYSRLYLIDALLDKSEITEALQQIILAEEAGRKVNDPRQLWDIMFLKGKAKRMQGKLDEALAAFKESIENVEKFRATLSLERLKRDFMASKTKAYEEIVGVLLSLNKPAEALSYVERAKARAFVDLFGAMEKSKLLKPREADKFRQRFKELEKKRRELEESQEEIDRQLRGIPGSPGDRRGMPFIKKVTQEMVDYQQAEDRLTEMAGAEFSALSSVKPSEIWDLRGLIDENTVLAEYFRGPSSDTVYLFVVDSIRLKNKNPFATTLQCRDSQLNLKILGFRNLLDSSPDEYSTEIHERSRELYKILISPFESILTGKKRLILVPHGNLNFLPFAALESPEGKILVDIFDLVYLPSANTFRFCREKNPKRYETLLAFAFGETRTESLAPLPNTLKEIESIGMLFPPANSTLIKGGSPSLEEFSEKAGKKDVIHLATHGILHPNLPLESSIMLGKNAIPVKDVMTLDLKAGLVTLSACQTGIGKIFEGDEIVGLTRAFMYAGTPSVLSSLWPVSDESTSMLMSEFFKNFKDGKDKAASLRAAQQAVRAKFPSPYHWASFILTGDWL